MPTAKKRSRGGAAKKAPDLRARVAKALGVSKEEAVSRAVRELADRLGLLEAPKRRSQPPAEEEHYLPQRLYLLLDGRGLDGRGMPVEVIDLPCVIGSGKRCSVWINSPQIETRHLQITQGDQGWVIEDLGSEHGTTIGGEKLEQRVIENGDEYRLAGYLRLRAELR